MAKRFTHLEHAHPAGLGRRLGAMLYDSLLVLAIWVALTAGHVLISRLLLGLPAEQLGQGAAQVMSLRLLLLLGAFGFLSFFWRRGGMTLGMQAWRLRVQTPQGLALNWRQCLVRFVVGGLSWAALGVGHLWILWDPGRRSWADLASGTRVMLLPAARP
ncbi:RDD family protein [Halomonas sp. 18H]|uniref:RDD family protein n=1 Tax=Halomonas almeriensis TaxID=308163 RepID=UPI00222E5BA5|nr:MULTISPECIES: RDD family protein [Halomonas]MCW4153535.1 RDD family protein [Halomonas sp. 18H]MDN3551927.1 RDD family protein [Halomonas almeriensis]